jgi:hypothetical protein
MVCTAILSFIFLLTAILAFGPLQSSIATQAAQGVLMGANNYQNWGQVPGALGTNLSREFTFFNLTNPFGVVYLNETPNFVLTTPFLYQEYS